MLFIEKTRLDSWSKEVSLTITLNPNKWEAFWGYLLTNLIYHKQCFDFFHLILRVKTSWSWFTLNFTFSFLLKKPIIFIVLNIGHMCFKTFSFISTFISGKHSLLQTSSLWNIWSVLQLQSENIPSNTKDMYHHTHLCPGPEPWHQHWPSHYSLNTPAMLLPQGFAFAVPFFWNVLAWNIHMAALLLPSKPN